MSFHAWHESRRTWRMVGLLSVAAVWIRAEAFHPTIAPVPAKKVAEHGGFSFGDTNVGLIVSNPAMNFRQAKTPVLTSQVAATILKSLGIDPNELESVRKEGISVLPFLFDDGGSEHE